MKRIIFLVSLIATACNSYGQGWRWAKELYSLGNERVVNAYVTKAGLCNSEYVAGIWKSDSIIIGTSTYYNHHVGVNNYEAYLVKFDSSGNVIWSSASVLGQALPYAITTDNDGNVYMYGCFWTDSVMFGTHLLVSSHYDSCLSPWCSWGAGCYFIIKYDPAGNIVWAKSGDNVMNMGGSITIDEMANIYISGSYWNSTMTIGPYTLHNPSFKKQDIFIAKYDSSGNVIWAKGFGGIYSDYAGSIYYSRNRLYLTGNFYSPSISFGTTTLTFHSSIPLDTIGDAFIAKFDTSGNAIWAKSSVGSAVPFDIAVDNSDGVYIGGCIFDTSYVSFTMDTLKHSHLQWGGFLTKYDTMGNVLWTKGIFNTTSTITSGFGQGNRIWAVTTDPCNNVWVSGHLSGDVGGVTIDSGVILHAPTGSWDPIFLAGYNSSGALLQNLALRSGSDNGGRWGLNSDNGGYIYLSSEFNGGSMIFASDTLLNHMGWAMFLARYNPSLGCNIGCGEETLIQKEQVKNKIVKLYPNPATSSFTISGLSSPATISIYDLSGRLLQAYAVTSVNNTISTADLSSGMYVCTIRTDVGMVTKKLVVMK